MSSGETEWRFPLERPGVRLLWCLERELVVRLPRRRGLATSAMVCGESGDVAVLVLLRFPLGRGSVVS